MRAWAYLAGLLLLAGCERQPQAGQQRPADKPKIALLTSLPIVFSENFSLEAERNPLLEALEERFQIVPVDGPEQLKEGQALLAIQPQAMTAERLVALDDWVRAGGRLVLLADPALMQRGERPLGDRFTPPYSFPDTGLLSHWGLTLEPEGTPTAEDVPIELGGGAVATRSSFGQLRSSNPECRLTAKSSAARCRIGEGKVTIVADADFAIDATPPENQQAVVRLVSEYQR